MSAEIIPFTFRGDPLQVVRLPDGDVGAVVRRLCEVWGLDPDAQLRRLQRLADVGARWAVPATVAGTGADGKTYELLVLPRRSLPMFAATVDASRVDPSVREKLIAYQDECADALAAHFLDGVDRPRWTAADFDRSRVTTSADILGSFGREGRAGLTIALAEHLTASLQRGDDEATQALHAALTRLLPAAAASAPSPRTRDLRAVHVRLLAAVAAHRGVSGPFALLERAHMAKSEANARVIDQLVAEGALVLSATEGYQVPSTTGEVQ